VSEPPPKKEEEEKAGGQKERKEKEKKERKGGCSVRTHRTGTRFYAKDEIVLKRARVVAIC
jgi:hypothetical protein